MNYKMIPIVKEEEIVKAVSIQYDIDPDDISDTIYDHFPNDYSMIYFDEDSIDTAYVFDERILHCILTYLADVFAETEYSKAILDRA